MHRISSVTSRLHVNGSKCKYRGREATENIGFLVVSEEAHHNVVDDQVPEALENANLSAGRPGNYYHSVNAHDNSNVILGNVYNVLHRKESNDIKAYGLCLASAPLINTNDFVGRTAELDLMREILSPGKKAIEQRRLVLGGMGGVGKTQLAIAYARQCQSNGMSYTSVFWFEANTELTLKKSFRSIAGQLLQSTELEQLEDKQIVPRVHDWLSDTRNTQWLLIFDNYDNPDEYAIDKYTPNTAHGTVIFTTRRPDLVRGPQVRVQPIEAIDDSLRILQIRSRRDDAGHDPDARNLATRLAGLPLALVTAGAYLRRNTLTFREYLDAYSQRFNVDPRRPVRLQEYSDRTLHTTWDLSYRSLEANDRLAAKVLKLLAYFDHQAVWYGLVHAGLAHDSPPWLQELAGERINFEGVMATLVDYCLVEVHEATSSYSMHSCVHDWTLAGFNQSTDVDLYWYAFNCVLNSIGRPKDRETFGLPMYCRITPHAIRLTHEQLMEAAFSAGRTAERLEDAMVIAELLRHQIQVNQAIRMCSRVLMEMEKMEIDLRKVLATVNTLGAYYGVQENFARSEEMYKRALAEEQEKLGPEDDLTLRTLNELGIIYRVQGRFGEAEEAFKQALACRMKVFGPKHRATFKAIHSLGNLYFDQRRLDEAERMYVRARDGFQQVLGPSHSLTLMALQNIGLLYIRQGKSRKAKLILENLYDMWSEKLGPEHLSTAEVVNHLGRLYFEERDLDKAEQFFRKALAGKVKALGLNHSTTFSTFGYLGEVYFAQGKLSEAEHMFQTALDGYMRLLGPTHPKTLTTLQYFGQLYLSQSRLLEAEPMFVRALTGCEKTFGREHRLTLHVMKNLDSCFRQQGKSDTAEQIVKGLGTS